MAKSDFCFTFYDGDAARDMSHMNRLERGAYTDLIISQRKFGHLTKEQIKKTLGNDFGSCWEAISLVMKTDEKNLFFIEWLDTSEKKAKKHSKHQSDKRKGKTKHQPDLTKQEPNETKTQPLGDGDVYEDGIGESNTKEYDFKKPDIGGDEIVFPIDTPAAHDLWAKWKEYRWREHGERYGMMGEQADLKRFNNKTYLQMEQSILAAIAGGWKNLYPESNKGNNNGTRANGKAEQSAATAEYLKQHYSAKAKQQ